MNEKVKLMGPGTRYIYIALLMHQWRHGSIPATKEELRRLLIFPQDPGSPNFDYHRALEQVLKCFIPNGNIGLINIKMELVRCKHLNIKKAQSEGGKYTQFSKFQSDLLSDLPSNYSGEPGENQNQSQNVESESEKKRVSLVPDRLMEIWQAERGMLPAIKALSLERRRKCLSRIRAYRGNLDRFVSDFTEAVRKCQTARFALGENDWGWKLTFDFLIANDTNILKVLEGKYDGKVKSSDTSHLERR